MNKAQIKIGARVALMPKSTLTVLFGAKPGDDCSSITIDKHTIPWQDLTLSCEKPATIKGIVGDIVIVDFDDPTIVKKGSSYINQLPIAGLNFLDETPLLPDYSDDTLVFVGCDTVGCSTTFYLPQNIVDGLQPDQKLSCPTCTSTATITDDQPRQLRPFTNPNYTPPIPPPYTHPED